MQAPASWHPPTCPAIMWWKVKSISINSSDINIFSTKIKATNLTARLYGSSFYLAHRSSRCLVLFVRDVRHHLQWSLILWQRPRLLFLWEMSHIHLNQMQIRFCHQSVTLVVNLEQFFKLKSGFFSSASKSSCQIKPPQPKTRWALRAHSLACLCRSLQWSDLTFRRRL